MALVVQALPGIYSSEGRRRREQPNNGVSKKTDEKRGKGFHSKFARGKDKDGISERTTNGNTFRKEE